MKNAEHKRFELEAALEATWDEITEQALAFVATLSRLRRAEKNSADYDQQWGELAATLLQLKLKAADADKLMEKVEALESQAVKVG